MCGGPEVNGPFSPFPEDIAASVQREKPCWLEEKICQEQKLWDSCAFHETPLLPLSFPIFSLI